MHRLVPFIPEEKGVASAFQIKVALLFPGWRTRVDFILVVNGIFNADNQSVPIRIRRLFASNLFVQNHQTELHNAHQVHYFSPFGFESSEVLDIIHFV